MHIEEVEPGRWVLAVGGGLALELLLAGGVWWAFWRWEGELVAEAAVGQA